MIEPADTIALKDALRDDTTLFFTESPTNPYLRVVDLPEAARIAHERGVQVLVDATFASPVNHTPLADGADLVIHSATKYLGGHNDLLAGAVAGKRRGDRADPRGGGRARRRSSTRTRPGSCCAA